MCVFEIGNQTLKLFRMGLFWDAHDREEEGGRQKDLPSPKPVTHPTMKKLGTVVPYLKKIEKNLNHVTHLLSSASISIFSLEISNSWFLILFTFFKSLKVFLICLQF